MRGKKLLRVRSLKVAPGLPFERLRKEDGIPLLIEKLSKGRKCGFSLERAVFLTVVHRLCVSGSDRAVPAANGGSTRRSGVPAANGGSTRRSGVPAANEVRGCKPLLVRPGRRVVREVKVLFGAYALRPLNRR